MIAEPGCDRAAVRMSSGSVLRMEQHDEAYRIWRAEGVHDRVLVHVDAHHDMWWFDDPRSLTIANFICPALRDGLVSQVFWVVPDATWERAAGRRALGRHLRHLRAKYPMAGGAIQETREQLSTNLLGKRVTVCSLQSLPCVDVPVLLDVDVDFLMIPIVSHGEPDMQCPMPWLWPQDLLDRLAARGVHADLITIAYSVDGGYTPLKWKYLGDELAARLGALSAPIDGFDALRDGALAAMRGDHAGAAEAFRRAAVLLPGSPAPHHHLAHSYLAMGRQEEARDSYQRAIACDATYRSPYNNEGLSLYTEGRYREAEREWLRALVLDPADPYSYLGLARLAARRKHWPEAARHAANALALDGDLVDGYRVLGRVLAAQAKHDDAIRAYERSLRLALAGHRSIAVAPASYSGDRMVDPEHFLIFARLACLYAAKGDPRAAIENRRMALAGHCDGLQLRLGLAWMHIKQGRVASACREIFDGIRLLPAETMVRWRRVRAHVRQTLRHHSRMLTT